MDPILAAFLERTASNPRVPIAIAPDARVSRGELLERAREVSREIEGLGLERGSVLALVAPAGPGFLAAWLGLRWAGACVLLVDAGTPEEERARIARELGAAATWSEGEGWSESEARGRLEPHAPEAVRVLPEIASLKLTSGSTGRPAGIAVSAQQLLADHIQLEATIGLTGDDRLLVVIPLSHSYGFSVLACSAWIRGSPLAFPRSGDPLEAATLLEASVVPSVPSWYRARLVLATRDPWPVCTRLFLSAGAPLPPEVARAWRERTGRAIHVLYGSSECGGITYDRLGDAAERGSVGTPVDGVEIELVEHEDRDGRVVVRSPAVASGYVPRGDSNGRLAAGRFVTGDVGRMRDGELVLLGRTDDWINVKGRKVNPREVESVLAEMPGVIEAAVLAQPLPDGRGDLVRAVIASRDDTLRYRDVVVWCRARLAAHKIPRGILFVRALPRTDRGKLDRRALLALPGSRPDH
jgi:long-chain acyl-CoA synthetase